MWEDQQPIAQQEQPSPSSSGNQSLGHDTGLPTMTDTSVLLSAIPTRGYVNGARQRGSPTLPGAGATPSTIIGRLAGMPWALVAMLAGRDDMYLTLRNERPTAKRPDVPHCYARNHGVPKRFREAMIAEHAGLWEGSMLK